MSFTITFTWKGKSEEKSFQCREDQFIINAADEAGFTDWPWASRAERPGTDPVSSARLVSGTVWLGDQSGLDEDALARGFILYDVAIPTSDCVLVIGVEEELY